MSSVKIGEPFREKHLCFEVNGSPIFMRRMPHQRDEAEWNRAVHCGNSKLFENANNKSCRVFKRYDILLNRKKLLHEKKQEG